MLVKYWMSKDPVVADVNDSMQRATDLMKKNQIRFLPVIKSGKLVGVLTDRDLKRASASDATTLEIHELLYLLSKIKISDIMSKSPVSIQEDATIEEAAEILLTKKISGLPVLGRDDALKGVITQSDLFRALVSLTGFQGRGLHLALMIKDQPGSIMAVANPIREAGARMASIMTTYQRCPDGYRRVYFRIFNLDRNRLDPLLAQIRKHAQLLYLVDHRDNRREVFHE